MSIIPFRVCNDKDRLVSYSHDCLVSVFMKINGIDWITKG